VTRSAACVPVQNLVVDAGTLLEWNVLRLGIIHDSLKDSVHYCLLIICLVDLNGRCHSLLPCIDVSRRRSGQVREVDGGRKRGGDCDRLPELDHTRDGRVLSVLFDGGNLSGPVGVAREDGGAVVMTSGDTGLELTGLVLPQQLLLELLSL